MDNELTVAYLPMEIGLDEGMPTYSGGLGILAGDIIRSSADIKLPMLAVTLLYRKRYFRQRLDGDGIWFRFFKKIKYQHLVIRHNNSIKSNGFCF